MGASQALDVGSIPIARSTLILPSFWPLSQARNPCTAHQEAGEQLQPAVWYILFMAAIRRVLFVCTGNICRSAMAEQLLRHLSKARNLDLEIRSCGTAAESHYEIPLIVRGLLAEQDVPPFEHTPRLVTRELLGWADLALVMTAAQREHLTEHFPEFRGKVRLLREQAGFGQEDVADPMGRPAEDYARCIAVLQESLKTMAEKGFRVPDPS